MGIELRVSLSNLPSGSTMLYYIVDGQYFYPISTILKHQRLDSFTFFKVQWEDGNVTWEPLDNLLRAQTAIKDYLWRQLLTDNLLPAEWWTGESSQDNGTSGSTSSQELPTNLGISSLLNLSYRLGLTKSKSGARSSISSSEASSLGTIHLGRTLSGTTSMRLLSSRRQQQDDQSYTTSVCQSIAEDSPSLREATTLESAIHSLRFGDGESTTPKTEPKSLNIW